MELGNTGIYFRGAAEEAHSFGDLGSPVKKLKTKFKTSQFKGKASILFDFFNFILHCPDTPSPLSNVNVFVFVLPCTSVGFGPNRTILINFFGTCLRPPSIDLNGYLRAW